ncbi:hypothetical protein DsansV1_C38g0233141 [Dioscorea sansibarensis]
MSNVCGSCIFIIFSGSVVAIFTMDAKEIPLLLWMNGGPESSMASTTRDDSSTKSMYLRGGCSDDRNLGVSTFCEASHLSARPSPSSILSTSAILGRCEGWYCVHRRAT